MEISTCMNTQHVDRLWWFSLTSHIFNFLMKVLLAHHGFTVNCPEVQILGHNYFITNLKFLYKDNCVSTLKP